MRRRQAGLPALLCLLAACAPALVSPEDTREYHRLGSLELSAVLEQDDQSLYGLIEIMNSSRQPVVVEYAGACGVGYLLYQEGGVTPRWQSSRWWTALQGSCPETPLRMEIPGATLARIMAPALDPGIVLGDTLRAGSYEAAMRLRLLQPRDTTLILRAGPVRLDSAPASPPRLQRPDGRLGALDDRH